MLSAQDLPCRILRQMRFKVGLRSEFSLWADGQELSVAPNRSVAVLLVGLLDKEECWTSRADLSRLLYPESDTVCALNALRQTLFRLRKWLGEDVTEERFGGIRLIPGVMTSSWPVARITQAMAPEDLAPGRDRPWIDAIRLERRAQREVKS